MSNATVLCTWEIGRDGIPTGAAEALTLARKLATARGGELNWLIPGTATEQVPALAARHGVSNIDRIEDPRLAEFGPDTFTEAIAQYCALHFPRTLLLVQSFDARLIAPRVAARVGAGVVMNAVDLATTAGGQLEVTTSAYGGNTRAVYAVPADRTCVVGVLTDGLLAEPASHPSTPATRPVTVNLQGVAERITVTGRAEAGGARLEDAQIIVAGGRGLGSKENFALVEQLAAALGGMAGASRPIVDDGWTDSSRQVGLTGKITRPTLYIAAGISGASQHMVGCAAARTLVAINRDPDAAIFRYARYGIVGDCLEILPELIKAVRDRAPGD